MVIPLFYIPPVSAQVHYSEIIFPGYHMPKIIKCATFLKNNAKETYIENFTYKNDTLLYDGFSKQRFDSAGFLEEYSYLILPANGKKDLYYYDSLHQLTLKNGFSANGEYLTSFMYTYNEKGELQEIKVGNPSKKPGHITQFYYPSDTSIIREEYESAIVVGNDYAEITPLSLDSKRIDFYKNGLLVKTENIDSKGVLWRTILHTYDSQGRCIGTSSWSHGRKQNETQYELDENGNILQSTYIENKDVYVNFIQQFDNKQIIYKKHRFQKDEIEEKWEYDKEGNKTRYQKLINGSIVKEEKISYTYDIYSNWIKKTVRVNGTLISMSTRKIQY